MKKSSKIYLDKYYTPKCVAKRCIERAYQIIGEENITEVVEPSAGSGSFSNQIEGCRAYDIEPEGVGIEKQDFLELELGYKKGRLIIGNPPFGERSLQVQKFYRHSCGMGDYTAFIVPISQYNNEQSMYEFELIYSEDMGKVEYTGDRVVHTAYNIYKRPESGELRSKRPNYNTGYIEIKEIRQARGQYLPEGYEYDIGICSWGDVGKEVKEECTYNQEMYIRVKDKERREEILELIRGTNWRDIYPMAKSPTLKQWQVYRYIHKSIGKDKKRGI